MWFASDVFGGRNTERQRQTDREKRDGGRQPSFVLDNSVVVITFNNPVTRVIFVPGFSLHLLLGVLTASEQLSRRFVNGRTILAPAVSRLGPYLKPVVRPGPERRKHHVPLGSQFVADVRLVAPGIELHLYNIVNDVGRQNSIINVVHHRIRAMVTYTHTCTYIVYHELNTANYGFHGQLKNFFVTGSVISVFTFFALWNI